MATLITGGAGFVGLEVARQLLDAGESDITVFSRSPSPARLGGLADRVTAVAGDVGNFSHVLDVVRQSRAEVIYHLGACGVGVGTLCMGRADREFDSTWDWVRPADERATPRVGPGAAFLRSRWRPWRWYPR